MKQDSRLGHMCDSCTYGNAYKSEIIEASQSS